MRAPCIALLACLAAGAQEPAVRIECPLTEVEFGAAFPLTVVRTWSAETGLAPWSDEALAPLDARLVETEHDGGDEIRRYRARAFEVGEHTIAGSLHLTVRSALPPGDPGPPELPGGLMAAPADWTVWILGGLAGAVALAWLARRLRRPARPAPVAVPPPAAPAEPPGETARRHLARLREQEPRDFAEAQAWCTGVSAVLRDFLAGRFGLRTRERTTQEILAAAGDLAPGERARVREVLGGCDLAKFAHHEPGAAERGRLLESASAFVEATADGSTPAHREGR